MVMRKSMYKRKRSYKAKGKYVSATTAQRVRLPELKAMDSGSFGTGNVTSSGFALALNSIGTGADVYQRVGRQITMRSLEVRGYTVMSGNAFAPDFVRIAFVYDRQPDGSTAVWNDVFGNVDNAGTVTHDSFAFPDQGNRDRFKILADLTFPVVPLAGIIPSALQDQQVNFSFHRYLKLGNLEARYAAAATVPQSGQILIVAKGQNAAGSAQCNFVISTRLTYTDV